MPLVSAKRQQYFGLLAYPNKVGDRVGAGVGSQHSMKSPSPLGQHLSSSPNSRDAHEPVGFAVCAEQRRSMVGDTDGAKLGLAVGLPDGLCDGL